MMNYNYKNLIPMILIMSIATIFANIVIDPYDYPYIGSCPPQFPNLILELYNALFSSALAILLLKIFKIKFTVLDLMIGLNLYLVIKGLLVFSNIYGHDFRSIYSAILGEYWGKVNKLYIINFLTVGFLFSEE